MATNSSRRPNPIRTALLQGKRDESSIDAWSAPAAYALVLMLMLASLVVTLHYLGPSGEPTKADLDLSPTATQ